MKRILSILAVILGLWWSADAHAQFAHLTLRSDPGDYIGQGRNYDIVYNPTNGYFFSAQVRRLLPSGEPAELLFVLGAGPAVPFASLFFGTDQLGIPMQPGFYPDAQRADFAQPGHPGLDVSFDGRGCNTLTGSFTVLEFTYLPMGGILSFLATFEQHCEGAEPALRGTFNYQAVPEPGTGSLLALSCAGLAALLWRRRADGHSRNR